MELSWFITAFDFAASQCREFAQQFVTEDLPTSLRFDFAAANRPTDETGRIKFLGGRLLLPSELRGVEKVTARKYLWVDGSVPQWINLSVRAADAEHTYIKITVAGYVEDDIKRLRHQREGNPPFHILGPHLPPEWTSLEESGKFSLNWRPHRQDT